MCSHMSYVLRETPYVCGFSLKIRLYERAQMQVYLGSDPRKTNGDAEEMREKKSRREKKKRKEKKAKKGMFMR